jgi:F-type H+-transporting ATPase subunit alpha
LYARGFLPAIDITRSVSRIGGKAQLPVIKVEAGRMKLDYLQFLELEVFTRFGARLEAGVEVKIRRGRLLRELLKQERLSPLSPEQHMAWLIAYNEDFFDQFDASKITTVFAQLLQKVAENSPELQETRDSWRRLIESWMQEINHEPPTGN